jgi:hypothetical protein
MAEFPLPFGMLVGRLSAGFGGAELKTFPLEFSA